MLDFGIAKIISGDAVDSVTLSHKGTIYGTPSYMAPEQFGGGIGDPRVDIYAIGCIAFYLLTGEPLFTGHLLQLLEQHVNRPADRPSARRPTARIAPELDELVLRCLAKKPQERYQSARDLLHAIERLQGAGARTATGRRTHKPASAEPRDTVGATEWSGQIDFQHTADVRDVLAPIGLAIRARAIQEVVRSLAQTLADLDGSSLPLFLVLNRIKQLDDDLAHHDAQQAALDGLTEDLEEATRAREASVRFALGELHYERSQILARGLSPDPALDQQIHDLEARVIALQTDLEEKLRPVTDHSISLAGDRATNEEQATVLYAELERLVDAELPRCARHPQLASLAARLRSVRG